MLDTCTPVAGSVSRYARAIDWMAANPTDDKQQWYRAEAARVLGL